MIDVRKLFFRATMLGLVALLPVVLLAWQWMAAAGPDWLRVAQDPKTGFNAVAFAGCVVTVMVFIAGAIGAGEMLDDDD